MEGRQDWKGGALQRREVGGFTSGREGGYSLSERVYSWGSSDRGWLANSQQRDGENATQATVILQRPVEGDFAR